MDIPIDTVVLDIDGTLLDSNYHHAVAWAQAFDAVLDRHVPVFAIHRSIGMGGDRLVAAVAGDDVEQQHGEEIRRRWKKAYDALIDDARLVDGARELLSALQERGLDVVLASSSIPEHARHALDLLDADEHADDWTTSEDAEESKPDPELIATALEKVDAGRSVMIGDSVWDVEAAARLQIPTICLLTGGSGRDELEQAGAAGVRLDCRDLLDHLDEALAAALNR
ncbi:HAD family hydrolase [Nocardioides montaniterrae]